MIPKLPKGFTHPMKIGGGAFASVYRARQTSVDRWVAIKIIDEKDRAKRAGLLKEATTQAGMRVDCVPQIYDAFEWGPRVCIIMQWIRGSSLAAILEQDLAESERLVLADGFIAALARLHNQGYAHRDLKPANILVSPSDGVFLVDFGFAKEVADGQKSLAGTVKGTPAYMAPELWTGSSDIDYRRADVYSAGKVLKEILPERLGTWVADALLQDDPSRRPATGAELLEKWNRQVDQPTTPLQWDRLASSTTGKALSRMLLAATRQLLYAGRDDEAYWLLVECLEEDPDLGEAVALMSSFPREARQRARRRRAAIVVAAFLTILLAVGAFVAGRRSKSADVVARAVAAPREGGAARLTSALGSGTVVRADDLPLLSDSLKVDKLSGTLFIRSHPDKGGLIVDGTPIDPKVDLETGFPLSYGSHTVAWKSDAGVTMWRERVDILPFQTKGMDLVPRGDG
jgi:hypothetical protein